ncbi:protein phosphatase 2C domain-containing protein [Nocardiopsis algeriensis]|uniref:protein phosphatase 2C domain-containing protein n=1 Tax=Nocardiopsis algeriensis TaxID=1478215 RepID=UPI003B42AD8C
MPFLIATEPADPGRPNEDFAAAGERCAVVLDGVTEAAGSGCSHGVAWYVRRLGALLLAGADTGLPLREALAEAIRDATALHAGSCDTSLQETPSATVLAVRVGEKGTEYLVLSDSVLLAETPEGVRVVADTRLEELRAEISRRGGAPGAIGTLRNVPGGFWTAGSDPRAAEEALTGTLPPGRLALLTDGASRGVEVFGDHDWGQAFALVADSGPRALLDRVRALEEADPEQRLHPRGKVRDDATAVLWDPGCGRS